MDGAGGAIDQISRDIVNLTRHRDHFHVSSALRWQWNLALPLGV